MTIRIGAVILAAGLSRRMGKDNKLFLEYKGEPIINHVIRAVRDTSVDRIVVVTSILSHESLKFWESERVQLADNPRYLEGMTSSIQQGVKHLEDMQGYMVCLGDQPKITHETYSIILEEFTLSYEKDDRAIVLPFHAGKKGNPVVFSSYYREEILGHPFPEGCKEIVQSHKGHVRKLEIDDSSILQDVDTPGDYSKLI